jgi:hypothetical protein
MSHVIAKVDKHQGESCYGILYATIIELWSELPEESHILQLIVIKGIFVEHLQPEKYSEMKLVSLLAATILHTYI